jgi:hypothetical protein
VLLAQLQFGRIVEFADFTVDPGADEALLLQAVEQLYVFALAVGRSWVGQRGVPTRANSRRR